MFPIYTVVLATCLLTGFSVAAESSLTWEEVDYNGDACAPPAARSGGHLAYDRFCQCFYLFGGFAGDNYMWRFDIGAKKWTIVHDGTGNTPKLLRYAYHGILRLPGGASVFVISHGWLLQGGEPVNDTWVFNTETNTWNIVETRGQKPSSAYGGYYGVLTDQLWVASSLRTDHEAYTLTFVSSTTAVWAPVQDHDDSKYDRSMLILRPSNGRCGAALKNRFGVFQWKSDNITVGLNPCVANELLLYFDDNNAAHYVTQRVLSATVMLTNRSPGKALIYGGLITTFLSSGHQVISGDEWPMEEVFILNLKDRTLTNYMTQGTNDRFPGRRYDHMMAEGPNGDIYMFGGVLLSDGSYLNDLWILKDNCPDCAEDTGVSVSASLLHFALILVWCILIQLGYSAFTEYLLKWKSMTVIDSSRVKLISCITIQVFATVLTAFVYIHIFFNFTTTSTYLFHPTVMVAINMLMMYQPISSILQPISKKNNKGKLSQCIIIWKWFHRCFGVLIILFGINQVILGVLLNVYRNLMWVMFTVMMFVWVISFIVLQVVRFLYMLCYSNSSSQDDKHDYELV